MDKEICVSAWLGAESRLQKYIRIINSISYDMHFKLTYSDIG